MEENELEGLELYQLYELMQPLVAPEPISRMPQGPGWWYALCVVLFIVLAVIAWRYYRRYQQRHRFYAIDELNQLPDNFNALDLSEILKRCALQVFPRQSIACLNGNAWSEFLNSRVNTNDTLFSDFYSLQFQQPDFDRKALKDKATYWLLHFRTESVSTTDSKAKGGA